MGEPIETESGCQGKRGMGSDGYWVWGFFGGGGENKPLVAMVGQPRRCANRPLNHAV